MKSLSAVDLASPKLPPQNVEAEQSVLGAILLDNTAMAKAMEILTDEEFYRTAHRKIYQAMLELSDRGEVIDQITLTECLKGRSELESVGGRLIWQSWCKLFQPQQTFATTAKSSAIRRCYVGSFRPRRR